MMRPTIPAWFLCMLVGVVWGLPARAALNDILDFEGKRDKPFNMADKKFDTRALQGVKRYDAMKEFRAPPITPQARYPLPPGNKSFEKSFPVGETRVFTGESYLASVSPFATREAGGYSGVYATRSATGFTTEPNPMGNRTFTPQKQRYDGPELKRKTVEIDIINQTLKRKDDLKDGVLSMEEVREILNKRE